MLLLFAIIAAGILTAESRSVTIPPPTQPPPPPRPPTALEPPPAPPTTRVPPRPPQTAPSEVWGDLFGLCVMPDGTFLQPGHDKVVFHGSSCTYYGCDSNVQLQQTSRLCEPPRCVNAERGDCCMYCPNGNNCRLPDGEVISEGDRIEVDGMLCGCPLDNAMGGFSTDAVCEPMATPPPPPPPSTPPPPPPPYTTEPTPPFRACQTPDGQMIPPSEEWTDADIAWCAVYQCQPDGELELLHYGDCFAPICVDRVPGHCCNICPNGNNCRLPSGKILNATDVAIEDGMLCRCQESKDYFAYWSDDLVNAICEPAPPPPRPTTIPPPPRPTTIPPQWTTPPPPLPPTTTEGHHAWCLAGDSVVILPGEEHLEAGEMSCTTYYCDEELGTVTMVTDCLPPACVDPEQGECCKTCPNGNNCRLSSGDVIPAGEIVNVDGMLCKCPEISGIFAVDVTEAICKPPPTPDMAETTTPEAAPGPGDEMPPGNEMSGEGVRSEGCETDVGRWLALKPGEELVEGCEGCTCLENGTGVCYQIVCQQPACVDAVVPGGGCCEVCPNGRNCLLPSGQIIPADTTVGYDDNMRCRCPAYRPGDVWDPMDLKAYCWNVGEALSEQERLAARRKIVAERRQQTRSMLAKRNMARRSRIVEMRIP